MLGSLLTRLHPALRLLLALSLLLALGAALLWLANRQDQALSPELLAAQTRQPPAPEDLDGQMPLILAGFDAPASPQPVAQAQALGRARLMRDIERLNWSLAHGGHIGPDGPPLLPVSHALGPDDVLPPALRCNSASQPCAANVLARRADWQAHLASPVATTVLARYAAAVQTPRQDLPWPNFPLADTPRYHIIARSAQLLLAQASLALADGQDAAALQQLDHALHLPQRLAQYSANLLTSVSALHMMNLQLHWMSELLRQHPRLCHGPPAQALRATLARAQAPMADALRGEMLGMLSAAPFSLEYARALMDPHFDPLAPRRAGMPWPPGPTSPSARKTPCCAMRKPWPSWPKHPRTATTPTLRPCANPPRPTTGRDWACATPMAAICCGNSASHPAFTPTSNVRTIWRATAACCCCNWPPALKTCPPPTCPAGWPSHRPICATPIPRPPCSGMRPAPAWCLRAASLSA